MKLAFLFSVFYSTRLINLILVDRTGFLVVYWKQGKVKPLHFPLSLIILNIKWVHYPLNVWTKYLKKIFIFVCMHGQLVEVYSLFSPLWVPGTELRSSGSVASTYRGISMVRLIGFLWLLIFSGFLKC